MAEPRERAAGRIAQEQRQRLAATRQKSTGRRLVSMGIAAPPGEPSIADANAKPADIRAPATPRYAVSRAVASSGLTANEPNTATATGRGLGRRGLSAEDSAAAGSPAAGSSAAGSPPRAQPPRAQPPSTMSCALAVIATPLDVARTPSSVSRYGSCGIRTSNVNCLAMASSVGENCGGRAVSLAVTFDTPTCKMFRLTEIVPVGRS